jgi:hypothetical protein
MISVEHHVGRLVEVVLTAPLVLEEVAPLFTQIGGFMQKIGQGCVVTDLRNCGLFGQEVADTLVKYMRGSNDNPAFVRMAFLCGDSATHIMQVQRLTKAANAERRRYFTEYPELHAFLSPVLSAEELTRLDAFYGFASPAR